MGTEDRTGGDPGDPALIAHRGFAALAPENTVSAVRDAVARGADGVELDVRAAADGTPVVCHDATVDRVTEGTGAVADRSPAELGALSVGGGPDGVPTLEAALRSIPPDATVCAELKERSVAPAAADALADAGRTVVVSSFDAAALSTPRDRGLATALLAATDGLATVEQAADLGCTAVHLHATAVTEGVVAAAGAAGLDVAAWTLAPPDVDGDEWTVTDPDEVVRLRRLGVDALIADAPL